MKIVHLSKPWLPIPPSKYGAVERMVYALIKKQYSSLDLVVFTPGGSKLPKGVKVISLFNEGQGDKGLDRNIELAQASDCVLHCQYEKVDLIHAHSVDPFLALVPFINIPSVFTFYSNPTIANQILAREAIAYTNFVFLSKSHKNSFAEIKKSQVIYPGFDIKLFPFTEKKEEYLVFVGSISDKKGILEAIEISRLSGRQLKVAAKVRSEDKGFYENVARDVLNASEHVEFLGEVTDSERNKLLLKANALLFPIKWNEPFGAVMVEAMAVGTPVIAFNRGSVPEVICHNKTGYIVENIDEAVQSVKRLSRLNPRDCRSWVIENFSSERASKAYQQLYNKVLH